MLGESLHSEPLQNWHMRTYSAHGSSRSGFFVRVAGWITQEHTKWHNLDSSRCFSRPRRPISPTLTPSLGTRSLVRPTSVSPQRTPVRQRSQAATTSREPFTTPSVRPTLKSRAWSPASPRRGRLQTASTSSAVTGTSSPTLRRNLSCWLCRVGSRRFHLRRSVVTGLPVTPWPAV